MSRFENYINENDEENAENIIETIKKNCKPFLKEWKASNGFLYRGVKNADINDIAMRNRRKDRKPRDSNSSLSKEVDVEFKKKFGWKPRAEGVFTSGDYLATSIYGTIYLFFPIGKYRYVWSSKVHDFYTYTAYTKGFLETYTEITETYTDKNLRNAMVIGEIIFDVDKYYIVERKYEFMLKDEL